MSTVFIFSCKKPKLTQMMGGGSVNLGFIIITNINQ